VEVDGGHGGLFIPCVQIRSTERLLGGGWSQAVSERLMSGARTDAVRRSSWRRSGAGPSASTGAASRARSGGVAGPDLRDARPGRAGPDAGSGGPGGHATLNTPRNRLEWSFRRQLAWNHEKVLLLALDEKQSCDL